MILIKTNQSATQNMSYMHITKTITKKKQL